MQSSFTDYPQKCTVCGHLKTLPYTFNSTVPPVMCKCPKAPTLAWECSRCHKINAPWKGSCDCTPSPLSGAPTSTTQPYTAGPNPYTSKLNWSPTSESSYVGGINASTFNFPDPFEPNTPNI